MNRIIAFILLIAIASVRDIAAESNLRATGNSNSVVSHSQRRELSWWGSFYYNLFPHRPSGSGSSSSSSGSSPSSSSSSGSSNADGSAESGADADADADADASVEDVYAESDGGWNLSFEDIDGWQASYATIDGSESKSFGAAGGIMMVMAAMLIGAAMFTYRVRSAYTGWSFSI
jgi:activator of HSP90 ATPase